jgi:hypothetical protein
VTGAAPLPRDGHHATRTTRRARRDGHDALPQGGASLRYNPFTVMADIQNVTLYRSEAAFFS